MPDRLAENGLQLRDASRASACASACIASQARRFPAVTNASDPPATIASAYPSRIARNASPMLVADDEHAVEKFTIGPRKLFAIETWPAAALFIPSTTVVGLTRPFPACSWRYDSSMALAPPRPVPQ